MTTRWFCTACDAAGTIWHKADESVYTVIDKLKASHRHTSGHDCDIARMRVTLEQPTDQRPQDTNVNPNSNERRTPSPDYSQHNKPKS